MPLLEPFGVFFGDVTVLVDGKVGQLLVQLHKGVMRISHDSDRESFEVSNVFEEELTRVLPKSFIVVLKEAVLNHLLLVALHQELHNLVCVSHTKRL